MGSFTECGKVLAGSGASRKGMQGVVQEQISNPVDRKETKLGHSRQAGCIISWCEGPKEVAELAKLREAVIIETDLDTFSVSREINRVYR